MDIVISFKNYLFAQKQKPSKLTIKNYIADVRKFILWYENTFSTTFFPQFLTPDSIAQYSSYLTNGSESATPAARSTKRYISSLRKFCAFLEESGALEKNPFPKEINPQRIADPYFLKEFKNFLYTEQASKLTIKNYMADIKQFLEWLGKVVNTSSEANPSNLLISIDNFSLRQYKERLLQEAQLSPVSINRKLSSLRRYTKWLEEKGVLSIAIEHTIREEQPPEESVISEPVMEEMPLIALQGMAEEKENQQKRYSAFVPIRLVQKTSKIISLGSELLFFNPIIHAAEAIHYSLWKKGKKQVFMPVSNILESTSYVPQGISVKTIIPKASSILPPRTANIASLTNKLRSFKPHENADTSVHNFTKGLYAPLRISTKHMRWQEKLLHHLRYTRPAWYTKYHSFTFVHYIHFGVLILGTMIAAAGVYQSWQPDNPKQNEAVLSAQDTAPPRTLSFQGRLLDNNNTPITAETPLRFALYNSPTASGAAMIWQENQRIKPDQNGYFRATLGQKARLAQSVFTDNPSLYIGITVGDNRELAPRQQIPTTEYATSSQSVEGLKPITDSPTLSQNVLLALDSSGNLTIGGSQSHTFQATGGQFSLSGQALLLTTNPGSNGNIEITPNGSGIIDLQKPLQNTSNYSIPGATPGSVIVNDILSVLATSSSQSALVVNQNGSGDIFSGQANGIDKFRLDSAGNEFLAGDLILHGATIGTTSTVFDIAGANVTTLTIGNSARSISLGASSGITAINNSLSVHGTSTLNGAINAFGLITANAGLNIPDGQKLTLTNFSQGAIPFINQDSQLIQDAASFSWSEANKALDVKGSICVYTNTTCDSSHMANGTIYMNSAQTWNGDVAEEYVSSQALEPGDVVVLEGLDNNDAIIKSTSAYEKTVLGIVSTNPGMTLNAGAQTDNGHPHVYPLALQGRVPVKVSSVNGAIVPGDALTSSSIPGVAMKATGAGQVIGKALESYNNPDPNAVGKIMTFVNLTYQGSLTTITLDGDLAAASQSANTQNSVQTTPQTSPLTELTDITSRITLGIAQVQSLTTQTLEVTSANIMVGGQTLKEYITGLVEEIVNQELDKRFAQLPKNQTAEAPVASNSATPATQTQSIAITPTPIASSSSSILTANIEPETLAASDAAGISPIYNSIASGSAEATPSGTTIPDGVSERTNDLPGQNDPTQPPQQNGSVLDIQSPVPATYEPAASLSGQLSYVPNFKSDFATVTQGLVALGPTSLTDVSVSDSLSVNNNLKITQNSIDTIGSDLNIQPLRQGNILFMGGLVAIDTQGNLQVNGNATFAHNATVNGQLAAGIIAPIPDQDLVISLKNKSDKTGSSLVITSASGSSVLRISQAGDVISSGEAKFATIASHGLSIIRGAEADTSMTETTADGSAGTGIITAYETQRTIFTPYVTSHSLIYITPTSNTGSVTPYLARQTVEDPSKGTKGSFTVAIPASLTTDTSFNWWIVN